jgi:Tol biopolymer transport system component
MQVSADGGDSVGVQVPFAGSTGVMDISASGSELLVWAPPFKNPNDVAIWILPVPGGEPRRVGDLLAYDAAFAPGGTGIYYTLDSDIFTTGVDGSAPRKILTVNGKPYWIRFSPDGRRIRFSVLDTKLNTSTLWEAQADGSQPRQLLVGSKSPANECCGNWTGDGRYYVFQSTRGGVASLWTIRDKPDFWRKTNFEPVQLMVGRTSSESPLPNRDGSRILFIGSNPRGELMKLDPKTQQFAPYLQGISAEGLAFSKDGSRVAYVSYPEGILWQSKTDGSDRHELTFAPFEVGLPRWSPNGTQIVFTGHEPGKLWKIYVVPVEGGNPEVVASADYDLQDASWSPDGDSLAYGITSALARTSKEDAIRILDLKTRKVTTLPGSAGLFSPRWSPDGRYLLAMTGDFAMLKLYDFSTRAWEEIVKTRSSYPDWSRDGKCIYYAGFLDSTLPVYRMCLSNRKPELVVHLAAAGNLALGRFGTWTGIAPDESILAIRDISEEEIYALETKLP